MYNVVLFLLMIAAYAFASDRDYRDVELVATHRAAISVARECQLTAKQCDDQAPWHLAQSR